MLEQVIGCKNNMGVQNPKYQLQNSQKIEGLFLDFSERYLY